MTCEAEIVGAFEALYKLTGRTDFRPFEVVEFMVAHDTRYRPEVIRSRIADSALRRGLLVRSAPGVYRLARHLDAPYIEPPPARPAPTSRRWTSEAVKRQVASHLVADGWTVRSSGMRTREVGIDARRGLQRLRVTPLGSGVPGQEQRRLFAAALGEVVIHFSEESPINVLALPLEPQYQELVRRLSVPARGRLNLQIMWIRADGSVEWDGADASD